MIAQNLLKIQSNIPNDVCLVAVSKTKPNELLLEAYDAGMRNFGENYIQELVEKETILPKDINWHFIGHLQRNKVKYIAPFAHLIHGVDSLKLLQEINKQAQKNNRIISVLLQVHIAKEESKFGFNISDLQSPELLTSLFSLNSVEIKGLMGMSTNTDNTDQVEQEFRSLNTLYLNLKKSYPKLNTLSMGMSGDYKLAIECGSTMVRVGSSIFGYRK